MVTILSSSLPNFTIKTLADFPGAPEPEETGTTYQANARIKSESAADWTKELCVSDDAGLEIDALDGAPGVYSKRFGGEDLPFPEKMARILELLREVPAEGRTARFRCHVALTQCADGELRTDDFDAVCEGRIATEPSGSGGFGYDPIFFLPELGCTMADLTSVQKHSISHRGKVLKKLVAHLSES